ncbi:hypothetical protein KRR55_06090 [Paeniglutamicibacter sp. ABSL32-1]|uniref:hypothetical protein n=1 Tax=Paeniglutamicibacter quisquiliarum TaxID=2849498 RepID=UPI001C2D9186|nr:hypothetical protein [Paeniglutamicibacter quisquiliarum]MBV1778682.1 hypothetical protein [Paeniglutamicibacter quisquiliarum]
MFSMLPLPSPMPTPPQVIVNMPDTGAPWWGVPLLAGFFLLVGSMITFLSLRASDKRKAERDKAERIMMDTRSVGLEYLAAVEALVDTLRGRQDPSRALVGTDYLRAMKANFNTVKVQWGKFELFAHDNVLEKGKALDTACVVLFMTAFESDPPSEELRKFEIAKYSFINTLRKASGVDEIPYVFPDATTQEKLEADMARLRDQFSESLVKNFATPREK